MATIQELLHEIRTLDLVLPEFQREYVWTREQAKQLMVSLFKGYPTGSLLFWKTDDPPDIKNAAVARDKVGTTEVILDGQQRLTTLYLFTQDEIPPYYREVDITTDPRSLYFNLEDGDFQYYQSTRMSNTPTWVPVTKCFTASAAINVFEIAQRRAEGEDAFDLAQRYNDNLNRLRGISEKQYPVQLVPQSAGIDEAIDVFDRVNSLGTKLSDADLALAHITGKWPQARQAMKDKIEELSRKRFVLDLTFMVRALTGVAVRRALFDQIHHTPRETLIPAWEQLSRILDYLASVLPGRAFIHSTQDLNTTNVLVPVVVFLSSNGGSFHSDEEIRECIHWLYAASTWARYTSQTDQRLDHDIAVIERTERPWPDLIDAIIDQRGRIEVKDNDFEGRAIQHPLYRMAYIAIKTQGAVDWFNGSPLSETHGPAYQIHSHHIFPSSLLYSEGGYSSENHLHKKLVNEVANRAFLTGDSNLSLGNQRPSVYLPQIEKNYPGALAKQFVPVNPDLWELNRYEDFLAERRRLLADAINRLMGDLLEPEPRPDTENIESLISLGESTALEFKSSFRWDVRERRANKDLEKVIAKSVAGFLNSEGGTLLIGVADDGTILGLENDLKTIGRGDLDGFEQKLMQSLINHLGQEFLQYLKIDFRAVDGADVCAVHIQPSPQPLFLRDGDMREFYARIGNTTRPFDMESAHAYISMHWET